MSLIRKISIGRDYKNDAMHYSVGQEVYGGIYKKKRNELLPWKDFNKNMAIAIEYDLQY